MARTVGTVATEELKASFNACDVTILNGTASFLLSFRLLLSRFTLPDPQKDGPKVESASGPPIKAPSVTSCAMIPPVFRLRS
jgi:hypothetical protein